MDPALAPRFFEGYPWRFIFADIPTPGSSGQVGGTTTTWANGLINDRQILRTLDDADVISGSVFPDDRQVWELADDGYPLIAQTKRIVYCFRREGRGSLPRPSGYPSDVPWVPRAAGILMVPEDQANADVPVTHFTAYSPWKYLEARPALNPNTLEIPSDGYPLYSFSYGTGRADEVIGGVLLATIQSSSGGFCFIDAGPLYGGTAFWGGTIESCAQIPMEIQDSMSVADVWRQVCDSGLADIILTPIYDPVNRPGYTHELSIYRLAGSTQPTAVFSWDKMNRTASSIDRLHDATPPNFANIVEYSLGQGAGVVPVATNPASISDFGYYWATQVFPFQTIPTGDIVEALANQTLSLSKQGKRSIVLDLTPERSPIPFNDYDIGDFVPVYATRRLRVAITDDLSSSPPAAFRIQSIPITITDDGIEQVTGLLVSPDWREPVVS